MSPQEKAKELVDKFMQYADKKARPSVMNNMFSQGSSMGALLSNQSGVTYNTKDLIISAKQCALISVNEIVQAIDFDWIEVQNLDREHNYWENVKNEIERL